MEAEVNMLASKLGVKALPGDCKLSPIALTETMIKRAQAAGRTEEEIEEGLKDIS